MLFKIKKLDALCVFKHSHVFKHGVASICVGDFDQGPDFRDNVVPEDFDCFDDFLFCHTYEYTVTKKEPEGSSV